MHDRTALLEFSCDLITGEAVEGKSVVVEHHIRNEQLDIRQVGWQLAEQITRADEARDVHVAAEVLVFDREDIDNVRITIVDKGALDCTLKARIEGAVFRSVDQYENLPWGGAIR